MAQQVRVIYDAQTINWLESLAAPLLKSANLDQAHIEFALIEDDTINAFVTPDRTIYFHTGLFLKAETADEVHGVLAHEIGHIKGRHHVRLHDAVKKAKYAALAGGILGLAAAAAGGGGDAAVGLALGGQAAATSSFLSNTRSQEYQADRIALNLLKENEISAAGLAGFFDRIQSSELLFHRDVPAYLRTHPLTTQRVNTVKAHVEKYTHPTLPPQAQQEFLEIQAKIFALTASPARTLRKFSGREDAPALLASSIARALQGRLTDAFSLMEKLEKTNPDKPYYKELVAQILLDKAQFKPAADKFKEALALAPKDDFLRLQWALALQAAGADATPALKRLVLDRPSWPIVHRQLGIAYGKQGQFLQSFLALAEEARLREDPKTMEIHLQQAEKYAENATDRQKEELNRLKEFQKELKR